MRKPRKQTVFLIDDCITCLKCKVNKHKSCYRKDKHMYMGYNSKCKDCQAEHQRTYVKNKCSTVIGHLTFTLTRVRNQAKAGNKEFTITVDDLAKLYYTNKGLCALSGVPMTTGQGEGQKLTALSIDRIDSKIGYTKSNIQLVCYIVNIMKNSMTTKELQNWCSKIVSHN